MKRNLLREVWGKNLEICIHAGHPPLCVCVLQSCICGWPQHAARGRVCLSVLCVPRSLCPVCKAVEVNLICNWNLLNPIHPWLGPGCGELTLTIQLTRPSTLRGMLWALFSRHVAQPLAAPPSPLWRETQRKCTDCPTGRNSVLFSECVSVLPKTVTFKKEKRPICTTSFALLMLCLLLSVCLFVPFLHW